MELKAYLTPLIKYWWLLLVAGILAATSSFLVTRVQPPTYQSHTTLVIGRAVYEPNPTNNDFWLNQQLAGYYADLATRDVVRNATMAALGLDWLPQYNASLLPNSQLLSITVVDTDPVRAQAVARELANQLIKQTPVYSTGSGQENEEFIDQQLALLKTKITETEDEIAKQNALLQDMNSARQIADTQQQISVLETKLSTLQNNYAMLLSNSSQGAINSLTVIEPANLPTKPIAPNKMMMILLSMAIALIVAAGAAYLLEYLDDTLKTPEEITRLLHLPVIGNHTEVRKENKDVTYIAKRPRSAEAEAFRTLRTNLEYLSVDKPLKTILVSSVGISEGKTYVASNLAIVLAQGGKKVCLLDADMRKPSIHNNFEISSEKGLSDAFLGHGELKDIIQFWGDEKIMIIPSGKLPPNPSDLLDSQKMNNILEQLKKVADVIIIDAPPFVVSDSISLATKVDGVLLVVRYGYTRKADIIKSFEQLTRIGADVLGVTINRTPRSGEEYYRRLYYSSVSASMREKNYNEVVVPRSARSGGLLKAINLSGQPIDSIGSDSKTTPKTSS
jgi:succinoglycan biosynthesis transport protein ExoP